MAASVLTLFLANPIQSGSSAGLLTLTQPATSTSTTGWTVGKIAATNYSRQSYNQEEATTTFTATAQLSGAPITLGGHLAEDCWRTSAVTTGVFSAGTWYSGVSVISVTAAATGTGNANFRIWRSVNADGTAATEITKSNMTGTNVANLLTTVAQTSSASTQVAGFSLAAEYLFFQAAWKITVASGSNTADTLIRQGAITSNVAGSFLATSAFSATLGIAASRGGYLSHHYYRDLVEGQV